MDNVTVYVTAHGVFLPGKPISNDHIERYLGAGSPQAARIRDKILAANGIRTRYYARSEEGKPTHSNAELAMLAARNTLRRRGLDPTKLEMLAVGTSLNDALFPGMASLVHGQLGGGGLDVLSTSGVCVSGMAAMQAAWHAVATGHRANALVVGTERSSAILNQERFREERDHKRVQAFHHGTDFFNGEFLRWMLSDGAGALLIEPRPNSDRTSLRVDLIEVHSYAHRLETCMYLGLEAPSNDDHLGSWLDYPTAEEAEKAGLLVVRQNTELLGREVCDVIALELKRLVDAGNIDLDSIDHAVVHISSFYFWDRVYEAMERHGVPIPQSKWFTNLADVGNIGAASIFVMLEEAMSSGRIRAGEKVLLLVPESARFTMSYAVLTCVAPPSEQSPMARLNSPITENMLAASPVGIALYEAESSVTQHLARELAEVWSDFLQRLSKVPVIERIESGMATLEDYRNLLLNIRQQVVHGGQWISRTASNFSMQYFPLRSAMIKHAADEHRDYRMLEDNFVACGGDREEILSREKNLGSEALSAFIFQQASQPDPLDLLGAIYIIEGTGFRKAGHWARCLRESLDLREDQVSFLAYHGDADDTHMDELRKLLSAPFVTEEIAHRIVRTAKVTARLYLLQLEEINNV